MKIIIIVIATALLLATFFISSLISPDVFYRTILIISISMVVFAFSAIICRHAVTIIMKWIGNKK